MRRRGRFIWGRRLGLTLVILSLAQVPLPVADFHAVRHLDGEGQVCPMHDHLLRWHPSEDGSAVPVLHFHWAPFSRAVPSGAATGGPALHADLPDPADSLRDDLPKLGAETSARPAVERPLSPLPAEPILEPGVGLLRALSHGRPAAAPNFGATFSPLLPSSARLQRWIC